MRRQVGETYEFENGHFIVQQNAILKQKDVPAFMIKMLIGMVAFLIVFGGFTVLLFAGNLIITIHFPTIVLYTLFYLVFIVVHELLHGISFVLLSKNSWKTMKFGVSLKSGVAYCISQIPISVIRTKISLMMPLYIVCIPLYIIALITTNFELALFTIFLASGSVGDLYYMWKLRDVPKSKFILEEMPSSRGYEIGFLILEQVEVR